MNQNHQLRAPVMFTIIGAVVFLMLAAFGVIFLRDGGGSGFLNLGRNDGAARFEKFASESEFREYIQNTSQGYGLSSLNRFAVNESLDIAMPLGAPAFGGDFGSAEAFSQTAVNRVSETNVQVKGIDEPDIVKTDGRNIFFSSENYSIFGGGIEPFVAIDRPVASDEISSFPAPNYEPPSTKIIGALPPESISMLGEVDTTGELLLSGNTLVVISYDRITGFDVSDSSSPMQVWQHKFDENHQYKAARLMDGKVYLVTSRYADYGMPCPMPIITNGLTVPCTDIYRIGRPISADTAYSLLKLNPINGDIEDSTTFIGSSSESIVYVSQNAIYASFTSYPSPVDFMGSFFSQNTDIVGKEVSSRIANLQNIDISNESKINELTIIIQKYLNTLSGDERKRVESELSNRMSGYIREHGRELQRTSIVKIDKNSLDALATGEVAGAPLNQFSMDEFNGNLRIATTLNARTNFGSAESENDLYVLNGDLNTIGQIQGLALGERIYSARFIGNNAYLVTFKQIDPFFVIDLSNPTSPTVAGELKIPGFSSYLHPLSENTILGVGQENSQSKVSIFDVSNPQNPIESQKFTLNEFWSEVSNDHHAFLVDTDNQIFFMPAGASGYIFDYSNGLTLMRVVSDISARRALYINDFLYIVGDQKIVVLNEITWEIVGSLEF